MERPTVSHRYEALRPGHFRLIRLLEYSHDIHYPLCVELIVNPLCGGIMYEALSYCWAGYRRGMTEVERSSSSALGKTMLIRNPLQGENTSIRISISLDEALRSIAHETNAPLFVDQICINQEDLAEKSVLVGLMGEIYSNANRVLAWTGPLTCQADTFFQYVEFLDKKESQAFSQLAKHDYPTFNAIRASIISPEGEMASALRGLADDIEDLRAMALDAWHWLPLQGLVDFCSRQWFGRMWVVQEACLPKRLVFVCGNKTCDASLLERALLFTFLAVALKAATWNEDDVGRHYPTMDDMTYALALVRFANRLFGVRRTIHRESDSRFSVLSLLAKFNVADTVNASTAARDLQKFRAGDARDCYFSILALPRQDDPVLKTVRVDYASSAQLVFRDLAGSLVEAGQTDLILFSQNHVKRLDGLPSWVPDWTSELTKPHGYMNSETPLFCAGMAQGSGAIWGGYTDTHVEGGALFIPGLDAGAVEMVGTNYYEISASETETAQSLDLFLSDTTAFSSLATQNNKHLTAGYSQEDLAALLASGGRGILPRPSPGPSQHVGATMQGRTIAGATYQVLRRRTARHVRAIRRMVLSKLQATTSQESGNGPYMPEAHQSLELSLEGAIRGDGCEAREDGEGSAEETESTQMLRSEADVDDEEGIGPDLQVEVRLAEGVYGLAVDGQQRRRCFLTSGGRVGLGPEDMRRGDRLVILKGASVPMVLRRLTLGGGEMWGYVGEAYCYGIMDGEMFDGHNDCAKFHIV